LRAARLRAARMRASWALLAKDLRPTGGAPAGSGCLGLVFAGVFTVAERPSLLFAGESPDLAGLAPFFGGLAPLFGVREAVRLLIAAP
jgi:hypothetical protein